MYELFDGQLPGTTIVTIAHRSAVSAYHTRHWVLSPNDGRVELRAG